MVTIFFLERLGVKM